MSQIIFDWWFQIKAALCEKGDNIVVSHIKEIWEYREKNKTYYNYIATKKKLISAAV